MNKLQNLESPVISEDRCRAIFGWKGRVCALSLDMILVFSSDLEKRLGYQWNQEARRPLVLNTDLPWCSHSGLQTISMFLQRHQVGVLHLFQLWISTLERLWCLNSPLPSRFKTAIKRRQCPMQSVGTSKFCPFQCHPPHCQRSVFGRKEKTPLEN